MLLITGAEKPALCNFQSSTQPWKIATKTLKLNKSYVHPKEWPPVVYTCQACSST